MVFARKADDALASLVKKIDQVVADNTEAQLASFVNLLGPDANALDEAAKKMADEQQIKHVALVVPVDHQEGPSGLQLHPEADVTVILYKGTKVVANRALATGGLSDQVVDQIVDDVDLIKN
jgi:hypothetical protein